MDEVVVTPSAFKQTFERQIQWVEFSPYEWSQHLICVAFKDEIVVATVRFQEEDEVGEEMEFTKVRMFNHEFRVHAIAWSPETSLTVIPKILSFAVAGSDFNITLFNSNLDDVHECNVLSGHKDYINSIAYETEGELLASISDDHTCKLWEVKEDQTCILTFPLTSPGMSVRWHIEEPGKLMVAEKNGLIRMYNVRNQQAYMSFDSGMVLLSDADWGLNPLKIACLTSGELIIWDVTRPSRPVESRTHHIEGGNTLRFSPVNEHLIASIGRPDNLLKVMNTRTKQVVMCGQVELFGGLSWHQRLPFVCAGSDKELRFWRINN